MKDDEPGVDDVTDGAGDDCLCYRRDEPSSSSSSWSLECHSLVTGYKER